MNKYRETLSKFAGNNIVVIGDVMLDQYLEGEVSRISPEAPVPIARIEKEYYELGGAGNVASNVSSLGGQVSFFSFIGKDGEGEILKRLMRERNISFYFDVCPITTRKTRIIGKSQQLLRIDKEETSYKIFSSSIKDIILEKANESKIIIISDYAKGVITEDLMNLLKNQKKKIIVDPKPKNKFLYQDVFLITPNEKECLEMSSCKTVNEGAERLKDSLNSNVLVTRGEKGMMLYSDKILEIPTYAKEVYDVTGAGDTVIATISLSLASGFSLEESAIIANHAASIAVEKRGTYSVGIEELKKKIALEERKIITFDTLKKIAEDSRRKHKKIVWTNGCFDLLHIGHIRYLQEAKKMGDLLILGLNSDESVRKLKGEGRPIQSQEERAEILSSLEFVDHIIIFPELSVERYLEHIKPDIFAKGASYNIKTLDQHERALVEKYGGEIRFIDLIDGKSTTNLISKIKNSENSKIISS